MSAVRRQSIEWWEDEERTQAVPVREVRAAAAAPLRTILAPRARSATPVEHPRRPAPAFPALPDLSRVLSAGLVVAVLALLLYLGITGLIGWARLKLDDLHYGRPRTFQTSAYVGHEETAGNPTHFVAMNLNRRVTVVEFPGGDVGKPRVIAGPYLFGRAEDLTVVRLWVEDLNGDERPDLTVRVKDERLVYINENGAFRPVTAEELARLQQQEGVR